MTSTILFSPNPIPTLLRLFQSAQFNKPIYTLSPSFQHMEAEVNLIEELNPENLDCFANSTILLNRTEKPIQSYLVINSLLIEYRKHNINFVLCVEEGWYTSANQRADFVVFDHVPQDWVQKREVWERFFPYSDMDSVYAYFDAVASDKSMVLDYRSLEGVTWHSM